MTRFEAWAIHGSNFVVGGTGVVYAWMRYFVVSDDPFSIVNHPWQPQFQHAHILAAPFLIFAVSVIWSSHVWRRIRSGYGVHRKSGLVLALMLFPMIVSGYAFQVAVEEAWRDAWKWVHLVTSAAWLLFAAVHPLLPIAQQVTKSEAELSTS